MNIIFIAFHFLRFIKMLMFGEREVKLKGVRGKKVDLSFD